MPLTDLPNHQADQPVSDILDGSGVNSILNLTTTAVIGRVGLSNLEQRKYYIMEALSTGVKWGFDSSCPFDLFKSQLIMIPLGDSVNIYFKMSTGTGQVSIAEVG